tara:strand:- start:44 stop:634 length:591 start_codon:yes stop_codon:yes gene_type:complete
MNPFWGKKDTSVSFCEDAYTNSNYIAEYYNTLTGFLYVIVGLLYIKSKISVLGYICVFLGIGTIMLHMTQRYYGQIMDELMMIWLTYLMLNKLNRKLYRKSIILPLSIIYLCYHNNFIIFFAMFSTILICLLYESKKYKLTNIKRFVFYYHLCLGVFSWFLDQLYCDKLKHLYLHCVWHYCTSIVIYIGLSIIEDV